MSLTLTIPGWDLAMRGPASLGAAGLPIVQGIFAVVAPAADGLGKYRLLYIDETDNLADRVTVSHEAYGAWLAEAGRPVAWLGTPMLTARERQFIVRAAIDRFDPPCNRRERLVRWMARPARIGIMQAAG
jgi:hypothetical protein